MAATPTFAEQTSNKRARSPSGRVGGPPTKSAKTQSGHHTQINYLARQNNAILPPISRDEALPSLLNLIGEYDGVLHRHESLAGNLGARLLGPILVQRFERLFYDPPRVLKSHGKDCTINWLDVVNFAKTKPEQFKLEKMRNGVKVCQFYTRQCRVEISEEDYILVASEMPQKLIPPQPIQEDEEKELDLLTTVEKNVDQVVELADQASARARQLSHRLKNRKSTILGQHYILRRQNGNAHPESPSAAPEGANGDSSKTNDQLEASQSPPTSFTAVNIGSFGRADTSYSAIPQQRTNLGHPWFSGANTDNVTVLNGTSIKGIAQEQRVELIKSFLVNDDMQGREHDDDRPSPLGTTRSARVHTPQTRSESLTRGSLYSSNSSSAVPIPNTPTSLLPHYKPNQSDRDDSGPFKTEMVSRMESLHRGDRIVPPCDRCRRLHMDCLKNLTACMGCTKKHAKCSWKDVRDEELINDPSVVRSGSESSEPVITNHEHHSENENHNENHNDDERTHAEPIITEPASPSRQSSKGTMRQGDNTQNSANLSMDISTSMSHSGGLDLHPPALSSLALALTPGITSPPPPQYIVEKGQSELAAALFPAASNHNSVRSSLLSEDATPDANNTTTHNNISNTTNTTNISSKDNNTGLSSMTKIDGQLQDAANGLAVAAEAHNFTLPSSPQQLNSSTIPQNHSQELDSDRNNKGLIGLNNTAPCERGSKGSKGSRPRPEDETDKEEDEGDRLQALAAQVYRSAG